MGFPSPCPTYAPALALAPPWGLSGEPRGTDAPLPQLPPASWRVRGAAWSLGKRPERRRYTVHSCGENDTAARRQAPAWWHCGPSVLQTPPPLATLTQALLAYLLQLCGLCPDSFVDSSSLRRGLSRSLRAQALAPGLVSAPTPDSIAATGQFQAPPVTFDQGSPRHLSSRSHRPLRTRDPKRPSSSTSYCAAWGRWSHHCVPQGSHQHKEYMGTPR